MATPNMSLVKPTEGGSTDVWDTVLNTLIDLIDAHDHTSGKGVKVPTAGLNINADLNFGGYRAYGLKAADFNAVTAASTAALNRCLFVDSSDNELYWRTSGGTAVKLTSGTSLNYSLVGGITGDYSSTDADLEYEDANKIYRLLQDESPDHYANMAVGNIDLYEPTSGITNRITVKCPTSLAASYNYWLPPATPAAGKVYALCMNENGYTDTNENGEVDDIYHKELELLLPPAAGQNYGGAAALSGDGAKWTEGGAGSDVLIPIPLKTGDYITSIYVNHNRVANTTNLTVYETASGVGGSLATAAVSTGGVQVTQLTVNHALASGKGYVLKWAATAASANELYDVRVCFTRPKP